MYILPNLQILCSLGSTSGLMSFLTLLTCLCTPLFPAAGMSLKELSAKTEDASIFTVQPRREIVQLVSSTRRENQEVEKRHIGPNRLAREVLT